MAADQNTKADIETGATNLALRVRRRQRSRQRAVCVAVLSLLGPATSAALAPALPTRAPVSEVPQSPRPTATAAAPEPLVYALIVANNVGLDERRPTLRYADDDGARYRELLAINATAVALYTVLDHDTQRIFPELVSVAHPPKRQAIIDGIEQMFSDISRDVAAGHRVTFYFVFTGHGDKSDSGEGFVHLLDGPWTRGDLFRQVVARSPATVNHIIIDACNAYFMVAGRGGQQAKPDGDYSDLIRSFVASENLSSYPNTGVVVSTTAEAEVHEWGRIQAGVFSHELRSALAGAADANSDGAIDYEEVGAFLAAANGAIPDPRAHVRAFARAPSENEGAPLLRLASLGPKAQVPGAWSGRYYVEDDRGVRYADFNKAPGVVLDLRLVPRPRYYVHKHGEPREVVVDTAELGSSADGTIDLGELAAEPERVASRGSTHDIFDRFLFAQPFGPEFVAGFEHASLTLVNDAFTDPALTLSPPRSQLLPWVYGSTAAGVGMAVGAIVFETLARRSAEQFRNAAGTTSDVHAMRLQAQSQHRTAEVLGSLAATSVAFSIGAYLYERLTDSP